LKLPLSLEISISSKDVERCSDIGLYLVAIGPALYKPLICPTAQGEAPSPALNDNFGGGSRFQPGAAETD
jgi:hypothetical protein